MGRSSGPAVRATLGAGVLRDAPRPWRAPGGVQGPETGVQNGAFLALTERESPAVAFAPSPDYVAKRGNDDSRSVSDMTVRPDILHAEPTPRRDTAALHQALVFAFASGGGEDAIIDASRLNVLAPSDWEADCFAGDLFLKELVDYAMRVAAGGQVYEIDRKHMRALLSAPPAERRHTNFRQAVLQELGERPELRESLEAVYVQLRQLRTTLAGAETMRSRVAGTQRRIDILQAVRRAIDTLASSFLGATSGLKRLRSFGLELTESTAYKRLTQLLDFENSRATLDSRLQVGYDGTLRRFEIVRVSEAEHSSFSSSVFGRFVRRVISLLKGYRFSEDDIVARLLDEVFSQLEEALFVLLPLISELEFYLAALGFRDLAKRHGLEVCLPEFADADAGEAQSQDVGRELRRLFNPWLLAQRGEAPVPTDIDQVHARSIVIVTGPNSGGKTRVLQALAVTQLLGQCGFYVPAESARLTWTSGMFLSLLEHVSADQEEGRLGMELLRIRRVFETSAVGALIILDELCSGTNPSEGEEMFQLVLSLLEELSPQVFISTHFLDFALRLTERQGKAPLEFLQVELDERELPTYQFVAGVAKTSLARKTAARLGVTREELLSLVERQKRSHEHRSGTPSSGSVPAGPRVRSDQSSSDGSGGDAPILRRSP